MTTTLKPSYGTVDTITATGLASLANNAAFRLAAVDDSTNLPSDRGITVTIKTGASGVSATGTFSIYLYSSIDGGTNYSAGGSTAASYTMKGDNNEIYLGTFTANANATTYVAVLPSLLSIANLKTWPQKWGLIVLNGTGAAFDATGANFAATSTRLNDTFV